MKIDERTEIDDHTRRKELQLAVALVLPAFLIMAVVTLYPLVRSFGISLRQVDLMRPDIGQPFVGLDNYRFILSDPLFWDSVRVTACLCSWPCSWKSRWAWSWP